MAIPAPMTNQHTNDPTDDPKLSLLTDLANSITKINEIITSMNDDLVQIPGSFTADNLMAFDANGDAVDTGIDYNAVMTVAGGTFAGIITLAGDPVGVLDAATKQYVDAEVAAAGGGGLPGIDDQTVATQPVLVLTDFEVQSHGNLRVDADLYVDGADLYIGTGTVTHDVDSWAHFWDDDENFGGDRLFGWDETLRGFFYEDYNGNMLSLGECQWFHKLNDGSGNGSYYPIIDPVPLTPCVYTEDTWLLVGPNGSSPAPDITWDPLTFDVPWGTSHPDWIELQIRIEAHSTSSTPDTQQQAYVSIVAAGGGAISTTLESVKVAYCEAMVHANNDASASCFTTHKIPINSDETQFLVAWHSDFETTACRMYVVGFGWNRVSFDHEPPPGV